MTVVLVPGFNGSARQPLLVRLSKLLEAEGVATKRVTLPRVRPTPALAPESEALAKYEATAYAGRSFGGRVCIRLPARVPRVLLGFPIRPPGRPRPEDEAALLALRSPTLILQGSDDELGPLAVLAPLCAQNRHLQLEVFEGVGHAFGRHEKRVLERAAEWLVKELR
ncbi:MAG: dienelactone hydrolase family protein [Myxococcaceae bacterium]|nr:dienelactone hydrolase family protein [Myxococcaceae bacterium]